MRKIQVGLITFFCIAVMASLAGAIVRPPKRVRILPPPQQVEPLTGLLQAAQIGAPWRHEGLTIFPVRLQPARSFGKVLTLDEAPKRGELIVSELGHGNVNRVVAQNRSKLPVYLMAGEVLGGAKQDRMVSDDVLLPPRSRTEIAVFCVEHGRWTDGREFKSGGFIAPMRVRGRAAATKSQQEVWDSVSETQSGLGAPPGSLATVPQSPGVQAKIKPYRERLLPLPKQSGDICGVVVAYGGEWLAADVFYEPSLFHRLWPKLLDSYLTDVSSRPNYRGAPRTIKEAEEFLGQLYWANRTPLSTPGQGRRVELHSDYIFGSALIVQPSVVHLEAFPGRPDSVRGRHDNPSLQYRRGRLEQGPPHR